MALWKINAMLSFSRKDSMNIEWDQNRGIPTFWVEAASQQEAILIATDIVAQDRDAIGIRVDAVCLSEEQPVGYDSNLRKEIFRTRS